MLLSEAYEEIMEKVEGYPSPESIIRKINQARNRLIRTYGTDLVPYRMDLNAGQADYPWPYSPGSISHVLVDGKRYPLGQSQNHASRYFYMLAGVIGIYPTPEKSIPQGLTIFHKKTLTPLTLNDMNAEVGFDPDYDMLLVYGVLNMQEQYDLLLSDYLRASKSPEPYQIQVVEW